MDIRLSNTELYDLNEYPLEPETDHLEATPEQRASLEPDPETLN